MKEGMFRKLGANIEEINIRKELSMLRKQVGQGHLVNVSKDCADLYLKNKNGREYFIDITSAKPNMKEFKAMKRKILIWQAIRLSEQSKRKVEGRIAIPYNPYHPKPYERWTLKGLYDLKRQEVMVGKEFWNFIAKDDIYDGLLDAFESAGAFKSLIDQSFSKFK